MREQGEKVKLTDEASADLAAIALYRDARDHFILVKGEDRVHDEQYVPRQHVRVDDYTAAKLTKHLPRRQLSAWKANFDTKGMLKAMRSPFGEAAKEHFNVGAKDRFSHIEEHKAEEAVGVCARKRILRELYGFISLRLM